MDCACLFNKICSYGYYKKGVNMQVIRSTARRYFRGHQHGPTWKCKHPKKKPTKNARNHGKLTKRTSELHEGAINSKKRSQWEECRKGFIFCWTFKANVEPKLAQQKIEFWGGATHKRGEGSRFSDKRPNRSHLLEAPKLRWPRAPRSLIRPWQGRIHA